MSIDPPLSEMEKLLLMAAAVHGLGPNTDLTRANTAKVVSQALVWAGLDSPENRERWLDDEWHPTLDSVYDPLVRMTHQRASGRLPARPGPALFEGGGNWGVPGDPHQPPCDPHFNSCRLTVLGEEIAAKLLKQHPEYETKNPNSTS